MKPPSLIFTALQALCAAALAAAGGIAAAQGAADLGSLFRPGPRPEPPPAAAAAAATAASAPEAAERGVRVVLVGEDRRVASVNGRIVHVGDTIGGYRVLRIGMDEVVLKAADGSTERWPVNPTASAKRAPRAAAAPASAPTPKSRVPRQGAQP